MIHWKPFEFDGVIYDLAHLHPRSLVYQQAATGGKPEREYKVDVIFSLHCFTRGIKPDEKPHQSLLYADSRERRIFDFERYALSNRLPQIVEELYRGKCYHTERGNFFVVEVLTEQGKKLDYEVYFKASRAATKGVVNLVVQSAYVRDVIHSNRPKWKQISFMVILFNVSNKKPIKSPQ
jgi:hypothetical protein